jgi:hypothetical protein
LQTLRSSRRSSSRRKSIRSVVFLSSRPSHVSGDYAHPSFIGGHLSFYAFTYIMNMLITCSPANTHRETREMQDAVRPFLPSAPHPPSSFVLLLLRDNLEFLQWIKRYWDANYPGTPYDPVARRKGVPAEPPATMAPLRTAGSSSAALSSGGPSRGKTPVGGRRPGSATPAAEVAALHAQVRELSVHMEGLEKERDFYFAKVQRYSCYPGNDQLTHVGCVAPGYRDPHAATNRGARGRGEG